LINILSNQTKSEKNPQSLGDRKRDLSSEIELERNNFLLNKRNKRNEAYTNRI